MEQQYVVFLLNEEYYGVHILNVQEIVRIEKLRVIPDMPYFVEGIANLRGVLIPIINLKKYFGLSENYMMNTAVILKNDNDLIGITVDEVTEVAKFTEEQIEKRGFGNKKYLKGMVKTAKGVVLIFNMEELLKPVSEVLKNTEKNYE